MGALAPGFRFCPTDEELLIHYLRPKAWGKPFHQGTIAEVDIYKFEPWDLPDKSILSTKDPEWYFFSTQDKKYSHTARINRTTNRGYWKATGKDRKVFSGSCIAGLKKTLIYYEGRAPNGRRTNWIMHEYRLDQESEKKEKGMSVSVLCRIRKKGGLGPRNGEQYGAPVCIEDDETDDESKSGKVSFSKDAGLVEEGHVESANAFDLRNQVESLRSSKSLGSVKVEPSDIARDVNCTRTLDDTSNWPMNRHGTCGKGSNDGLKSNIDTPCFDEALNMWDVPQSWNEPYTDLSDMGAHFDLESFPGLPTLSNFDSHNLHDYVIPAFDEPEILGDLWSLVNENKAVENKFAAPQVASQVLPKNVNHFACACDDFIELDDIEVPLNGVSPRHAGNTLLMMRGAVQDPVNLSTTFQVPASRGSKDGRAKNVITSEHLLATQTQPSQAEMQGPGDRGISIIRESYRKPGASANNIKSQLPHSYYDPTLKAGITPHGGESSSRSYLSKHMSTYTVSKVEVAPPQLCYASLTDNLDGRIKAKITPQSLRASSVEDKNQIDTEKAENVLCSASLLDVSPKVDKKCDSSTAVLIKDEEQIDADPLGKRAVCCLDATASTSLLTKQVACEENKPNGIPSLASKACRSCRTFSGGSYLNSENASIPGCNSEVKPACMSSSRRHRLRTSLRGLKDKLKQSSLGAKIVQLEEGMRAKLNDRHFAYGKSPAQPDDLEDDTNPFDRLKSGILAVLYYLATLGLILSCLIWGYHIITTYASYVSVQ